LRGTTAEKVVRAVQPKAEVVIFEGDGAVFLALQQGRIVAYANGGILLAGLVALAADPGDYEVGGNFLSKEPHAGMVPENESKWRDFVNHSFMELIDNATFFALYDKWFGKRGVVPYPMTPEVRSYLIMQSMPE